MATIAAPWSDDSSTRRRLLPMVVPNRAQRLTGEATVGSGQRSLSTSSALGRMRSRQLRDTTAGFTVRRHPHTSELGF